MATVEISSDRALREPADAAAAADAPGLRLTDAARELVDEVEYRLLNGRLLAILLTPLVLPLRGRYCPTPSEAMRRLRCRFGLRPELGRSLSPMPLRPPGRR